MQSQLQQPEQTEELDNIYQEDIEEDVQQRLQKKNIININICNINIFIVIILIIILLITISSKSNSLVNQPIFL